MLGFKGWGTNCNGANAVVVTMTAELQQLILDTHNKYRNQQANGQTPNYGPATRMATMVGVIFDRNLCDG